MPKYLVQAAYSPEGLKVLLKDKASGRKAAITKAVGSLGGKVESVYYTFGDYDAIVIFDLPDNGAAVALSAAAGASGLVRIKTTPLLTVEETDQALEKSPDYRPPGR